jgi:hypothetical protein
MDQFGRPIPPKKKSRKALWITLSIVAVLCLVGGVLAVTVGGQLFNKVNNSRNTTVVAPDTLGGRARNTDPNFEKIVETAKSNAGSGIKGAKATVAAFYGTAEKNNMVVIVAVAGLIASPEREMTGMAKSMSTQGADITFTDVDAGPLGGLARCGDMKLQGVATAICGWADDGSVGIIMFLGKSISDVKGEFLADRAAIEKRS